MNAPVTIDTDLAEGNPSHTLDRLADEESLERAFLRAAWYASGSERASLTPFALGGDGASIAAFPLRPKRIGPIALNQVAGAYWPFRAIPVSAKASVEQLTDALKSDSLRKQLGPAWRIGPVIDDDPQLKKVISAAGSAGWTVLSRPIGAIFALDLAALTASGTWPSNKGQQKDRWRVRQLEKTAPVRIEHFTGLDWNNATRDDIAKIERNSWVGQLEQGGDTKFLDPDLRAYWEAIADDPAIAAMIRGSLMFVGDTPAAFTFGMDCGTTRYCIANNFDQQFHKHSPGRVLLYDDFTSAAARGITHLDWGLGDGGYKRQMGAEEGSSVSDLLFVRNPLLAALLRPVWER